MLEVIWKCFGCPNKRPVGELQICVHSIECQKIGALCEECMHLHELAVHQIKGN